MMNSQKVNFSVFQSFRRTPESSNFNMFWMPDQVRHDDSGTFYETVKIDLLKNQKGDNHDFCCNK